MQILEIYIHTIHIHSYTYIYNFFHHHHHPPPPTPPTPQGGGGYTTTHHHPHHPHHRGEGGTGALLYRPTTMGWGGGEVPSDAGPYIYHILVPQYTTIVVPKPPPSTTTLWVSMKNGLQIASVQPSPSPPLRTRVLSIDQ